MPRCRSEQAAALAAGAGTWGPPRSIEPLRPLLFSIAYRMLGTVSDAEDIVQEAFLRYHRARGRAATAIDSPKAFLSAVTTRLCIDHLRSARVRREAYVGEWLPEPLLTDTAAPDPAGAPSRPTRCPWRSCCCSNG